MGDLMPFDEGNKGDPFRGDFPGPPDPAPGDDLAARVHRQVTELAQRRYEPAVRHQRLGLLQRRRLRPPSPESAQDPGAQPPGTGAGGTITQFDFLPVTVGFDTLLARGELLITAQSYDGRPAPPGGGQPGPAATARAYLDALGMTADARSTAPSCTAGWCG